MHKTGSSHFQSQRPINSKPAIEMPSEYSKIIAIYTYDFRLLVNLQSSVLNRPKYVNLYRWHYDACVYFN